MVYRSPPIICKVYPFPDWSASNTPYFDFLDRLSSTACTEGLTRLSLRWIQPSQQHGRRIPSLSSVIVLLTCSFLVSSFLTKVTQQIHSLRARGVRSSHIASAALSEVRAFRKSMGNWCTTPAEIVLLISWFYTKLADWGGEAEWIILPNASLSTIPLSNLGFASSCKAFHFSNSLHRV